MPQLDPKKTLARYQHMVKCMNHKDFDPCHLLGECVKYLLDTPEDEKNTKWIDARIERYRSELVYVKGSLYEPCELLEYVGTETPVEGFANYAIFAEMDIAEEAANDFLALLYRNKFALINSPIEKLLKKTIATARGTPAGDNPIVDFFDEFRAAESELEELNDKPVVSFVYEFRDIENELEELNQEFSEYKYMMMRYERMVERCADRIKAGNPYYTFEAQTKRETECAGNLGDWMEAHNLVLACPYRDIEAANLYRWLVVYDLEADAREELRAMLQSGRMRPLSFNDDRHFVAEDIDAIMNESDWLFEHDYDSMPELEDD